jgi:hypothetical protein
MLTNLAFTNEMDYQILQMLLSQMLTQGIISHEDFDRVTADVIAKFDPLIKRYWLAICAF